MSSTFRKITERSIYFGVVCSLLAAIWSPEEFIKWVLTAIYLIVVGRFFGLSYRKEKVVGSFLERSSKNISFIGFRK